MFRGREQRTEANRKQNRQEALRELTEKNDQNGSATGADPGHARLFVARLRIPDRLYRAGDQACAMSCGRLVEFQPGQGCGRYACHRSVGFE